MISLGLMKADQTHTTHKDMNAKQKKKLIDEMNSRPFKVGDTVTILAPDGSGNGLTSCQIVAIDRGKAFLDGSRSSPSQNQGWLRELNHGRHNEYAVPLGQIAHSTFGVGANPFIDTWRNRAQPVLYTLDSIVGMSERDRGNVLEFDPHVIGADGQPHFYQRGSVWTTAQKRDLLQTIYEGGDIGTIVLHQTEDYRYNVVDGKQRLMTLLDFRQDKFTDHHGNYYSGLSDRAQHSFDGCRTTSLMLPPTATAADILSAFLSINNRGTRVSKAHIQKVLSIQL